MTRQTRFIAEVIIGGEAIRFEANSSEALEEMLAAELDEPATDFDAPPSRHANPSPGQ